MTAITAPNRIDTIVLCTSEQGSNFPHCKWTCYDTGLRTALIVRWPARIKAGAMTDAMMHDVDIVPTLIAAAGGDPEKIDVNNPRAGDGHTGFDGCSFLPVLLGESDKHRDVVFGIHTTRGIINGTPCYPIRSIRTDIHHLIWNPNHEAAFQNVVTTAKDRGTYWSSWREKAQTDPGAAKLYNGYQQRPEFELYDLREDPWELNNLAGEPDQQELLHSLHNKLQEWMQPQGDKGVETEMAVRAHKRH